MNDYQQRLIVLAGLYVTLSVSLNLINGITGQFSIGHAAFYQIGAYATGYLSIHYIQAFAPKVGGDVPWLLLMIVVGAIAAAIAGLLVGLPSLRLRGDYLAIVTLGFGEIVRIVVQNNDALGGSYALANIPRIQPIWVSLLLAVVCIAVCRNLLKTARGQTYLAVREDEVAAAAMGVNITGVKVTAFMIGSAFAGAAGAVLAHYEGVVTPQTFTMDVSFIILTMVVLGGNGSITGSVFAALFLFYLPEYLRDLKSPDGSALIISGGAVLAGLLAVGFGVAVIRWALNNAKLARGTRVAAYFGSVVVAVPIFFIARVGIHLIPTMATTQVQAGQLRMVIFAVSLIAIMLIRPQGIFAHHEFSWTWVRKLFGKPGVPTEIAA